MAKKKKKRIIIFSIIGVFLIIVFVMLFSLGKTNQEIYSLEITDFDLTTIQDGEYIGEYFFSNMMGAEVKVVVENNEITSITFIEHRCGLGGKAKAIVDDVITAQSLDVDTISGATGSSIIILKSIEDALGDD